MTLDEAIKHCLEVAEKHERHAKILKKRLLGSGLDTVDYCLQCAADHRQLAKWLTELKEAKQLLKAAVEDLSCGGENNKCTKSCKTCTYNSIKGYGCRYFGEYHWRYAAEALALIGEDTNVPASADDTNVGHKSGGWISVKDRLPENDVEVMLYDTDCGIVLGWYDDEIEDFTAEFISPLDAVTHWQPLPEPPKDGEQNG